jgi:hypothetical protein
MDAHAETQELVGAGSGRVSVQDGERIHTSYNAAAAQFVL